MLPAALDITTVVATLVSTAVPVAAECLPAKP